MSMVDQIFKFLNDNSKKSDKNAKLRKRKARI